MPRKQYDKQFKIATMKFVLEEQLPVAQVAKNCRYTITRRKIIQIY